MKEIIISILKDGNKSVFLNRFIDVCLNMSKSQLCILKNIITRNELMNKFGCSVDDLAFDSIADLFETEEGAFIQINDYFANIGNKINNIEDDEIAAYLACLVRKKTDQQLSIFKEDFGDIFIKIRKKVTIFLQRNAGLYSALSSNGEKYIKNNSKFKIDFSLPQISEDDLISNLFQYKFNKYNTPEIIKNVFAVLKSSDRFCQAINYKTLLNVVKIFYEKRMSDYIYLCHTNNTETNIE